MAVWLWHHLLGAVDGTDQGHPVTPGRPEVCESSRAPKKELLKPPSWQTALRGLTPENLDEGHIVGRGDSDDELGLETDFITLYTGLVFEISKKQVHSAKLQCSQYCRIVSSSFYTLRATYWCFQIKKTLHHLLKTLAGAPLEPRDTVCMQFQPILQHETLRLQLKHGNHKKVEKEQVLSLISKLNTQINIIISYCACHIEAMQVWKVMDYKQWDYINPIPGNGFCNLLGFM